MCVSLVCDDRRERHKDVFDRSWVSRLGMRGSLLSHVSISCKHFSLQRALHAGVFEAGRTIKVDLCGKTPPTILESMNAWWDDSVKSVTDFGSKITAPCPLAPTLEVNEGVLQAPFSSRIHSSATSIIRQALQEKDNPSKLDLSSLLCTLCDEPHRRGYTETVQYYAIKGSAATNVVPIHQWIIHDWTSTCSWECTAGRTKAWAVRALHLGWCTKSEGHDNPIEGYFWSKSSPQLNLMFAAIKDLLSKKNKTLGNEAFIMVLRNTYTPRPTWRQWTFQTRISPSLFLTCGRPCKERWAHQHQGFQSLHRYWRLFERRARGPRSVVRQLTCTRASYFLSTCC